jgi:CheY-like chemotaxis protein
MNYAAFQARPIFEVGHPLEQMDANIDRERNARESSIRVLLVEDVPDNQRDACRLLFRWGIKPAVAANGLKAVELCQEQVFDVILMDIAMPVMDGLEATRLIRSDELAHPGRRYCPIVAYTSGGSLDDQRLWKKIGVDAVLNKPTNPDQMAACLRQWCGTAFDGAMLSVTY